ncbi:BcepNY3gp43 [Burkholderia phage BcepNY3]|uniref:Gp44 n=2 Tax=Naesvirus TaxID=2733115 RepID=Q6UIY7_9CAUD|nr:gp44 [Burkholderia phage Bcep1]YP_001294881.1 BcepNY3gp43 [Burkholderia phage BcepNY3]AAQ73391.1 gp44 [Burkholderia phage Bcep1]ABR10578.1 BcepNY3gp43 [Burkholderia phage BcepNY3]
MDDVLDFLKFIGALALALVIILTAIGGGVGGIVYVSNRSECAQYHTLSGRATYFSWSTDCLVRNDDGKWVMLAAFKGNTADVTVRNK